MRRRRRRRFEADDIAIGMAVNNVYGVRLPWSFRIWVAPQRTLDVGQKEDRFLPVTGIAD